jgi:hypothetical protein
MVDVSGIIKNASGERYIDYPAVTMRFPDAVYLRPFYMPNLSLGGTGTDVRSPGGVGVNNIGLLVTTVGNVTYVDTASPCRFFYVDDGSRLSDGVVIGAKTMTGARVQINNLATGNTIAPPLTGDYVCVTGICAPFSAPIGISAQLRPRVQADVVIVLR